jgi:hypothetical protein
MSNPVTFEMEAVVPPVVKEAARRGSSPWAVAELLGLTFDQAFPPTTEDKEIQAARFHLAGRAGRFELLKQEGGCVPSAKAAELYLGHHPTKKPNPETTRKAARENRLVAVRDGHGEFLFPVWQFAEHGGALPGLNRVLEVLGKRPGFSEITPFVFFLQHHPRVAGRPIDALRAARIDEVLAAAVAMRE